MNTAQLPQRVGLRPGAPADRSASSSVHSLYVHVPFCERKCEYCDFTSVAGTRDERVYVDALIAELRMLGRQLPGLRLDTVFVGGGTPSLIDPAALAAVLATVGSCFDVAADAEVSMEANPSSTSVERAATWRAAGFNRISLGVQSLEPDILRFLGRVHDAEGAIDAVNAVRRAGFTSINCDLIYAVPGLGDARWQRTLERIVELQPSHVSCYELTVEHGTPLHTMVQRGTVHPVDAERALRQHEIAQRVLADAGFAQYEVSNFAVPGAECRHNLAYWRNRHYIAAGVGAHGHVPAEAARALGIDPPVAAGAVRFWHGRGIRAYCAAVCDGLLPIRDHEPVTARMEEEERIMLGLRLRDGVILRDDAMRGVAVTLRDAGLLSLDGDVARVTPRGETVLNAVTLQLTDALQQRSRPAHV